MDVSFLNPQQQLAVQTTEGKVRVIGGAGTGKTLVLVSRYAYIVNELGILEILLINVLKKIVSYLPIFLMGIVRKFRFGHMTI